MKARYRGFLKSVLPVAAAVLIFLQASPAFTMRITNESLKPIAKVVRKEIRAGRIPGAVVLIGDRKKVRYLKAFGYRAIKPKKLPMTTNTIFDLASLTKVIATTTAVMQLAERGKLGLDEPVSKYWPEFGSNGKEDITIRELLTHYSGLRPDLKLDSDWLGYKTALSKICNQTPTCEPGTHFVYSDINFEILGEVVRRVSGEPLDIYCSKHIFRPLGMKNTFFLPPRSLRKRIAPTEYEHGRSGRILWGEVHDPTARRMGGVAGHAGLFSTASDLAVFAKMLLNRGSIRRAHILDAASVEMMTVPQTPAVRVPPHGLGWSLDAPLSSNRDVLFPAGSFGHKGYTGTFIWIDPVSGTYVIVLTNRVHPYGKGDAEPLREHILALVSKALGPLSERRVLASRPSLKSYYSLMKNNAEKVRTGIDVLEAEKFAPLAGLRVGLITNHSGLDSAGRRDIDLLRRAPHMQLVALFSPEHGLSGDKDEKISSAADPSLGLPVYSLYGDTLRPTEKMLEGIDALVFDVQDIGARFYTYISTMAYAMEEAARKGIAFYVLDRPNPLTGLSVQGPPMDEDLKCFTGYFPLPVRHGMTVGELAQMFDHENGIGADLHVIRMKGYRRDYWYDDTGLAWVNPSPNIHNITEAVLYPGVAMVEGSDVSVGRGTATPFELLGAPWVNSRKFASYLNHRSISGVRFIPADFTPQSAPFKNRDCHGVRIILEDRDALNTALLGIEIVGALYRLYRDNFNIDQTLQMVGSRKVVQSVKNGVNPKIIARQWQKDLDRFRKLRSRYLLY
jgi:uncharacterized protein YbbC (DUF1343 family)/CubicO group peptidase (beta-lactamase class C family)